MNLRFLLATAGLVATAALAGSNAAGANPAPAYFRYPDIHGDRIVFSAEADLWLVSDRGGLAQRLTSHPGNEYFASFSPDGKQIAFSGQYDGNVDVYVISSEGGEPRRLTWHPGLDEVVGWTPDGKYVLFRSNRAQPNGSLEMWRVPAAGGDPELEPIGWATRLDIDPGSGLWAFNRTSWDNATWKRYRGGTAPQIWVGSPDKRDFQQITQFEGTNAYPMWHDGRIYFLSDRGGTANLWSVRPDGSDPEQHTGFSAWDARWPSMGPDGRIAFTLAADIHVYDPRDNREHKLDIELPSERTLTRERYPDAADNLTWFDLSPEGDRLAVTTRGEIFSVPVKKGVTLPVTRGSGARESWATFDHEGKQLLYVTDESREEEIRTRDAWGRGEPKVVLPASKGGSGWHFPPRLSPDGKLVAYSDQTQTLWIVPAAGGAPRKVDRSEQSEIRRYAWSPDSRWLAYSKNRRTDYSGIYIFDTRTGQVHEISGPNTDDYGPSWDPDGRYLYFISSRNINPLLGSRDWDNIEARSDRPYLVLLRKDVKDPMADLEGLPGDEAKKDDRADKGKSDEKKADKGEEKKPEAAKPVEIDFEGIADRVVMFRGAPIGNYGLILGTSDHVFYLSAPLKGFAEQPGLFDEPEPDNTLISYDLEKHKAKNFTDGVAGYSLSANGKKIAVMKKKGDVYVVDTSSPPSDLDESKVDMSGVVIELDPREEWAQIYWEAWRNQRDFFWDAELGGMDWKKIGDQYATLLPRVATRGDLRDLVGQLIGELNNSHTYTWGGDAGTSVPQVSVGLVGADVARDGAAYRVDRIYWGDPADNVVSPLRAPGAGVREGEYLLAVNHVPFTAGRSFYSYFENLAGKEVVLTVNSRSSTAGARDVVVKTLRDERELRHADWTRKNRDYVAAKTGGKIGYLHLPDMWQRGLIQFNTWFYPQLDKDGLIVDARWNGGGAVSEMIIERLRRRVVSFDRARGGGISSYPNRAVNGPFVVMTNEFAGSDGDIFPAVVQREKLAPVIGKRSWGGVVGIRGDKESVDGGVVTQPEFAWWEAQGGWTIENHGVDPDIVVENLPSDIARGVDAQLDRAIDEVMRLRQRTPPVEPKFGPVRKRTRDAFSPEIAKAKGEGGAVGQKGGGDSGTSQPH